MNLTTHPAIANYLENWSMMKMFDIVHVLTVMFKM